VSSEVLVPERLSSLADFEYSQDHNASDAASDRRKYNGFLQIRDATDEHIATEEIAECCSKHHNHKTNGHGKQALCRSED
jgi:hypothetical protein